MRQASSLHIHSPHLRRSGRRRRTMNKDKTEADVFPTPLPRKVMRKIFSYLGTDSNSPHSRLYSTPFQPQSRVHWVDFRLLLNISSVSRGWYEAIMRHLTRATALDLCGIFSSLKSNDPRYLPTILGVNTMLRRCTQLHCVCLRNCSNAVASTLNQLAESQADNMVSLFLEGCENFTDSVLYSLAATFPKLTFLDVARTAVTYDGLCEYLRVQDFVEGICTSLPYLPQLVENMKGKSVFSHLNWSYHGLTDLQISIQMRRGEISDLVSATTGLTHVELCCDVGDNAIIAIAYQCPLLSTLELVHPVPTSTISDFSVCQLAEQCVELTRVTLHNRVNITDKSLTALADHCPSLRYLDIRWCTKVKLGVSDILRDCKSLSHLLVSGCTNLESLYHIPANAQPLMTPLALRVLEATDCLIGDEQLSFLSLSLPYLSHLLIGSAFVHPSQSLRRALSPRCITSLLENCHNLENIHIIAPANLRFREIAYFFANKIFPNMKRYSFCINKSDTTTDVDSLAFIFEACPSLQVFRLPEYCYENDLNYWRYYRLSSAPFPAADPQSPIANILVTPLTPFLVCLIAHYAGMDEWVYFPSPPPRINLRLI